MYIESCGQKFDENPFFRSSPNVCVCVCMTGHFEELCVHHPIACHLEPSHFHPILLPANFMPSYVFFSLGLITLLLEEVVKFWKSFETLNYADMSESFILVTGDVASAVSSASLSDGRCLASDSFVSKVCPHCPLAARAEKQEMCSIQPKMTVWNTAIFVYSRLNTAVLTVHNETQIQKE